MMTSPPLELAQEIADQLAAIDGVRAVVLGGSWARGAATPTSDIDLGIYYDDAHRPSLDALRALAAALDDSHSGDVVTDYGAWGMWINGGAWLTVRGQRVDWLYRDVGKVTRIIDQCHAGQTQCYYQPGHPHGFHDHVYMGEVFYAMPLADRTGVVQALKERTTPYPPALKRRLIEHNLWEAQFALDASRKAIERDDTFYLSGGMFRSAACLVQVVFALNERYWINEKGSVRAAQSFPLCPTDFERVITHALAQVGAVPQMMSRALAQLETLVQDVRALVET